MSIEQYDKLTMEERDLECGVSPPILKPYRSWSTASTVATVGKVEEEYLSQSQHCVEMTSSTITKTDRVRATDPNENCYRTTCSVSIFIFGVILFAVISSTVLLCSNDEESPVPILEQGVDPCMGGAMEMSAKTGDESSSSSLFSPMSSSSTSSLWNPLVDLLVVDDPHDLSQYMLHDTLGGCLPGIVTSVDTTQTINNEWIGVQPTIESISVMGILPHIQMGEGSFLTLSEQCNIELSSHHNWTLSFAGARTKIGGSDIIFMSDSNELQNSSFAVCYHDENSLSIGACASTSIDNGSDNDNDNNMTIVVPLLKPASEFHVLTITYNEKEHRLQIYQNAKLVAELDFLESMDSTTLSWIGPSYSNNPSNIALRHVAYYEKHIDAGNVVEIADLILYMQS